MAKLAIENSSAFSSLLGKILPHTLAPASVSDGGGKITSERIVCWPDGRREVEGVTPKSLPPPDASNALPRPTDPTDDTDLGGSVMKRTRQIYDVFMRASKRAVFLLVTMAPKPVRWAAPERDPPLWPQRLSYGASGQELAKLTATLLKPGQL